MSKLLRFLTADDNIMHNSLLQTICEYPIHLIDNLSERA